MNKVLEAADLKEPLAFLGLERTYTKLHREAMWTDFEVLYGSYEKGEMRKVGTACLNEISRWDKLLNIWRGEGELMRLNRAAAQAPVEVSQELFDFLSEAYRLYEETDGAFDISSTPLVRCWGFFQGTPRVPSESEIEEALSNVGMRYVELDETKRTVYYRKPGVELTSASMAKGFALDRALRIAHSRGLENVLLNGGFSSVLASGAPVWKDHWQIDIVNPLDEKNPLAHLRLFNQGYSSSGSAARNIRHEGRLYSHLIDARTGWPARTMLNVNVVAPTASRAEALSTAFFVMGVEKTIDYCENHPEIGALILPMPNEEGKTRVISTGLGQSQLEVIQPSC